VPVSFNIWNVYANIRQCCPTDCKAVMTSYKYNIIQCLVPATNCLLCRKQRSFSGELQSTRSSDQPATRASWSSWGQTAVV